VTLLVDAETVAAPADTELLANQNATGGGRPDDSFRPTTVLAADHPLTQIGDPQARDLVDGTPNEAAPQAEQLAARDAERQIHASPDAEDRPANNATRAAQLLRQEAPDTLAAEVDDEARSQRSDTESDRMNPSASESALAGYLVNWRRRVERIGTENFPERFLTGRGEFGRPVLEVAIGESGALEDIVVRRSSGDATLDQAALQILRMAAPFDALPPEILVRYDVLRFAYEWDFSGNDGDGQVTD
jgi:protein TonB